jgi:hypothetical protein
MHLTTCDGWPLNQFLLPFVTNAIRNQSRKRSTPGFPACVAPQQRPLRGHLQKSIGALALWSDAIMPDTGYLYSAPGGFSLPWFGLFQWPRPLEHNDKLSALGKLLHDRAHG